MLYEKQDMKEKRRLLNFLLSNSTWKDGQLTPTYRKPFNFIAEANAKQPTLLTSAAAENLISEEWSG